MRQLFVNDVNKVLARENVVDTHGKPVFYDARSYKDMGLDTLPMRTVNRIVANKLKDGSLTVLDNDWTKKMIQAKIRRAAAERDPKVLELIRLDAVMQENGAGGKAHEG